MAFFGGSTKIARKAGSPVRHLERIEAQTGKLIRKSDFMPLPCNVERWPDLPVKRPERFVPVTRNKDMADYKDYINNTFMFS